MQGPVILNHCYSTLRADNELWGRGQSGLFSRVCVCVVIYLSLPKEGMVYLYRPVEWSACRLHKARQSTLHCSVAFWESHCSVHHPSPPAPAMAPKKAKKKSADSNSNVFSIFEQSQIQEFKEAFTIMDQNRDGFIDKNDLRDTFAALGRLNVKQEEIDEMLKEASGPVNFTIFLTMFGEKLKGADPEETILNAFKVFDPEGKGVLRKDFVTEMLTTQADRFSPEEMEQMFAAFPPDVAGNLDYKNLVHIITHGEEKDQE
ncbi:unnamed protein product [Oncorhynchus mykiss]|uniref:EF-hand domain-containing protein n=2 Tax=Oncorhynchus TaxID=8016 RepID=A0A060WJG3_ONCMY|nr:unnamed protein product [Oncorhynchus mykiss]